MLGYPMLRHPTSQLVNLLSGDPYGVRD